MFFWNSFAFSMIQLMLAIWSLVPLPFCCYEGVKKKKKIYIYIITVKKLHNFFVKFLLKFYIFVKRLYKSVIIHLPPVLLMVIYIICFFGYYRKVTLNIYYLSLGVHVFNIFCIINAQHWNCWSIKKISMCSF